MLSKLLILKTRVSPISFESLIKLHSLNYYLFLNPFSLALIDGAIRTKVIVKKE